MGGEGSGLGKACPEKQYNRRLSIAVQLRTDSRSINEAHHTFAGHFARPKLTIDGENGAVVPVAVAVGSGMVFQIPPVGDAPRSHKAYSPMTFPPPARARTARNLLAHSRSATSGGAKCKLRLPDPEARRRTIQIDVVERTRAGRGAKENLSSGRSPALVMPADRKKIFHRSGS